MKLACFSVILTATTAIIAMPVLKEKRGDITQACELDQARIWMPLTHLGFWRCQPRA